MRFERQHQPLMPFRGFLGRLFSFASVAAGVIIVGLGIGVLGYHFAEGMPWIDALLNAAMILSGMGPVDALHRTAGKLFATFYAIFSGVVFLTVAGLLFAPVFHRLIHHFHFDNHAPKRDH